MIRTLNIVLVMHQHRVRWSGSMPSNIRSRTRPSRRPRCSARSIGSRRTCRCSRPTGPFSTSPANVAPIVDRHVAELKLQPLTQDQFGDFSILPMRLKAPDTQRARHAVPVAQFGRRPDPADHRGVQLMVALDADSLPIAFEGARKTRGGLTRARIRWVIVVLALMFLRRRRPSDPARHGRPGHLHRRPSRATSSPRRGRRSSIATGSSSRSISACRRCLPSRAASSTSTRRRTASTPCCPTSMPTGCATG